MLIAVSQERGIRYLHFGDDAIQGAMRLSRPFTLELEYTQEMMAVQLFAPKPKRVALLGLGAGSLAKYSFAHAAQPEVRVAELSATVINLARSQFATPEDSPRFNVVQTDAAQWIKAEEARAAWLLVDVYDATANGPALSGEAFYGDCRAALEAYAASLAVPQTGIMAVNLFGAHRSYKTNLAQIQAVFSGRVLTLPPSTRGNIIVFGFAGPPLAIQAKTLRNRAVANAIASGLPLTRYWTTLVHHNQLGLGDLVF